MALAAGEAVLLRKITITAIQYVNLIQVTIAQGFHLFPFRTEKLSLVTPMVLRNSGRVGSRRFIEEASGLEKVPEAFLYPCGEVPKAFVLCEVRRLLCYVKY